MEFSFEKSSSNSLVNICSSSRESERNFHKLRSPFANFVLLSNKTYNLLLRKPFPNYLPQHLHYQLEVNLKEFQQILVLK